MATVKLNMPRFFITDELTLSPDPKGNKVSDKELKQLEDNPVFNALVKDGSIEIVKEGRPAKTTQPSGAGE